jgi:hypothetical protein
MTLWNLLQDIVVAVLLTLLISFVRNCLGRLQRSRGVAR